MTVMHKLSSVVAGAGFALLPFTSLPVHAVGTSTGVQILDPSGVCASWQAGGTPAAPTLTCIAAAPPVAGAPSGCTLTAEPSTLPAGGGTVKLTAACSSGAADAATSWAWTGAGAQTPTTGASPMVQASVNVTASTTFTVTASNTTAGPGATKTATVTVGAPPPPPPSGSIQCSGFDNTMVVDIAWGANTQVFTQGFGGTTALVGRITVPNVTSTAKGTLAITEYGTSAYKSATVSVNPCVFAGSPGLWNYSAPGLTNSFSVVVGGTQPFNKVVLQPGTTYYVNIRNIDGFGNTSCPQGVSCEALIEFHKPTGT